MVEGSKILAELLAEPVRKGPLTIGQTNIIGAAGMAARPGTKHKHTDVQLDMTDQTQRLPGSSLYRFYDWAIAPTVAAFFVSIFIGGTHPNRTRWPPTRPTI